MPSLHDKTIIIDGLIRLVVPVSDPVRWSTATVVVTRMLNFLTGDRWILGFRPRPAGFETLVPPRPLQSIEPSFDSLALFSGGLDSLIGAIDVLESGATPLFISHAAEGATSATQDSLFRVLKQNYSRRNVNRLRISNTMMKSTSTVPSLAWSFTSKQQPSRLSESGILPESMLATGILPN